MKQALIATIAFALIYAFQIVLQQVFVRGAIEPLHLNFLSYTVSTIILTCYFLLFRKKDFIVKPEKKITPFFFVALIGWMLADFFAVYGLKFSSSINYSILSRLMIFVVFILSVFFLKEKVTLNKILSTILAVVGSILVIYKFQAKLAINWGDVFFLITVFVQSISSVTRQKVTKHISSIQLTYLMFLYASIIFGAITVIFMPIKSISSYGFILVNSVTGLIGFSLVNYAIQKGGAVFFTLAANMLPIFTILLSFIILKQAPLISQVGGGILIVASIFLFQRKKSILINPRK
jgi:drug/metabolite transporter (DMT)-like permease